MTIPNVVIEEKIAVLMNPGARHRHAKMAISPGLYQQQFVMGSTRDVLDS